MPEWVVRYGLTANGHPLYSLPARTGVPCTQPFDMLVNVPKWASDVVLAIDGRHGPVHQPAVWSPVTLVKPERHNPDAGLFGSDQPRVTLE